MVTKNNNDITTSEPTTLKLPIPTTLIDHFTTKKGKNRKDLEYGPGYKLKIKFVTNFEDAHFLISNFERTAVTAKSVADQRICLSSVYHNISKVVKNLENKRQQKEKLDNTKNSLDQQTQINQANVTKIYTCDELCHIIGKRGKNIKKLKQKYPKMLLSFKGNDAVSFSGNLDSISKCIQEIKDLLYEIVLYQNTKLTRRTTNQKTKCSHIKTIYGVDLKQQNRNHFEIKNHKKITKSSKFQKPKAPSTRPKNQIYSNMKKIDPWSRKSYGKGGKANCKKLMNRYDYEVFSNF